MTDYNSGSRRPANDSSSKVRHLDDIYEYDVYDNTGSHPESSRSARAQGSASGRRPSSGPVSSRTTHSRPASSRQVPARSASSSKRKLFRRRKRKFKKLLLIYIAVLVVILIAGSIIFSVYLSSYENSQPSHMAESIVKSYSSAQGIVDFVTTNSDKSDLMGNIDEISQLYATNIAGKSISYKENKDFRPDSPSYDIMADGKTVAKVSLTSQGSKWTVSRLEMSQFLPDSRSVSIDAPSGSTVTVNGMVLNESYITSSSVPEILANSLKYIADPPQYDTYEISGLMSDPQVQVTSANGSPMDLTVTADKYTAVEPASAEFTASVEERVDDAIYNYATYFIHMSFGLANYIVYGSELYDSIFGSDEMDPINTDLYNWEQVESYDFAHKSASNYVQYSDDCFTVDVDYALDMRFTDPTFSDNNQKMDATWVFVIEPLDGSWCISDIIAH